VRFKITVVSVVIKFVRLKITMRVEITLGCISLTLACHYYTCECHIHTHTCQKHHLVSGNYTLRVEINLARVVIADLFIFFLSWGQRSTPFDYFLESRIKK
jgi:hypothetical protein